MTQIEEVKVGEGATICSGSDRYAATVIEVRRNGREIVIQEDKATRKDSNGMSESQRWTFAPNPDGAIYEATLRPDGAFRIKGTQNRVVIGHRSHYYDFSR